jgi:hypothetical protein
MWRSILALVIALALALGVTGPKLLKMARIKGWVPGAVSTRRVITQKGIDSATRVDGEDSYWVSWVEGPPPGPGPDRLRVFPEVWESLEEGDAIELVFVPGDARPHLQNGIFVGWGNFAFDLFLLTAELGVAGAMAWRLLRRRGPRELPDKRGAS